jgi:Dockerin type I domain
MRSITQRQFLMLGSLLLVLVAIPATIFLAQQTQENRSRAAASTTLYFAPSATASNAVQANVGDTKSFDVMINPGSNLPSVVKLVMQYDTTKFQAGATPFVVNSAAFPTTIEGPVVVNGQVLISVSIGSDPTKAVKTVTKIGTLTLTAIAPTATAPTTLTFGSNSQVLSIAQADQSNENVLSTTTPTYVSILSSAIPTTTSTPTVTPTNAPTTVTPTVQPTATKAPTPTPTIMATTIPTSTSIPTQVATISPTINPSSTVLSFSVLLHGIGNSGDNANPTASDLSNKSPLHPQRTVLVSLYNDQNQLTATKSGVITYNPTNGNYTGSVDFGNTVPDGDYIVKIKDDTHLQRIVPGINHITPQQNNLMPGVTLVAGDINNDNAVNILDYNLLIGCYSDLLPAISCTDANTVLADLNDDGHVNQTDYNFFLREITVQSGN